MTVDVDLLRAVCNAPGLSGFEDAVQDLAAETLGTCCDDVRRDRIGNVIGTRKATRRGAGEAIRVVLAAHADEIGMVVRHIDEQGYIHFDAVGGINAQSTVSQPVTIHGREEVRGAVVPDLFGDQDAKLELRDLRIDVARPPDEIRELIRVGDPVTFDQEFVQLNDRVFMGRNFDDRVGTYCLLEAMRRLGPTAVDVFAVSTVQEEVGVRGIPVVAYEIEPQIGIALDGSLCRNAYSKPHQQTCDLGKGTGIYLMDKLTIGSRKLIEFLFEVASQHGIMVQRNLGGGTDASALQRTKRGALATTIGAPVRYMHSTVQICHADDIDATVSLLTAFLENAHRLDLEAW
jgi:putative aminopeptidase FrvX